MKKKYLGQKNKSELRAGTLGDLQSDPVKPLRKTPCKRLHRWVATRWNRRCSRCGVEQSKSFDGIWED